jgi:hypothetical protein
MRGERKKEREKERRGYLVSVSGERARRGQLSLALAVNNSSQ